MAGVLDVGLLNKVKEAKLLVVGAGGIGCELLKNLVSTGFTDIDIVDLDTIDVSNLNRQFLFQKQHVGQSKAKVARASALRINPGAKIVAHHTSIMNPEFGTPFFEKFTVVMNALDNRSARIHVNRMCLAVDVPLIDSGTAGYLGQVTVIKKGLTECYECQPKQGQKTYPGCTIRNTPSEPIHCIVWAKHLFNQLFGEADADEDVSPDTADPEAAVATSDENISFNDAGNVQRISTRAWAIGCGYDSKKLFEKLFNDDIHYLLTMDRLWKTRRPPTPLQHDNLPDAVAGPSTHSNAAEIADQQIWSVQTCADVFHTSVESLWKRSSHPQSADFLVWDKDDDVCLDFVTACANLRSHIFGIPQKSRFDVKSMAGNIIPAIATTNAIIAGLAVMELFKVLQERWSECRTTYLNRKPNAQGKLLVRCILDKPNPKCYVCCPKPEISIKVDVKTFIVQSLETKILKAQLNMEMPDVEIDDGKGTILISSEENETTENNEKRLNEFGIQMGTRLKCDDFSQNYTIVINIIDCELQQSDGQDFEIVGDVPSLESKHNEDLESHKQDKPNGTEVSNAGLSNFDVDSEDDLLVIYDYPHDEPYLKRKINDDTEVTTGPNKKQRVTAESSQDVILL